MQNLWCLCAEHWNPIVVLKPVQHVSFTVVAENQTFGISAVYASTNYVRRRTLWQELNDLQSIHSLPWCFLGDYNSALGAHEYRGSGRPLRISCDEFQSWTASNNLITRGAQFTWSNGRRGRSFTGKRLDRAICIDEWINSWSSSTCCTLLKSKSDHYPLLLDLQKGNNTHYSSFKFMKMWTKHPDCRKIVQEVWDEHQSI